MEGTRRAQIDVSTSPLATAAGTSLRIGLFSTLLVTLMIPLNPSTAWAVPRAKGSAAVVSPSQTRLDQATENQIVHDDEIRVRLSELQSPFTISGMSLDLFGRDPRKTPGVYRAVEVRWSKATKNSPPTWIILDRDTREEITRRVSDVLPVSGQGLRINLKAVPDRLVIHAKKANKADLIAHLDLDSYILGVLPNEMPASWPLESLKAQAVASRTFALYRKQMRARVKGARFDVEASVMDQVYMAPLNGSASTPQTEKVKKAVAETRGLVLRDGMRARPFAAYFHADCGGHTEDARAIWGGMSGHEPGVGTAKDESCPTNPSARWRVRLKNLDIVSRLRGQAFARGTVALSSIEPIERSQSGRILKLKLAFNDGESKVVSGHDFRMSVGHDKVRSTNFRVVKASESEDFELAGVGFGHGAGLCQWGARHMASQGRGFKAILAHYYPNASLAKSVGSRAKAAVDSGVDSRNDLGN